MSRDLRGRVVAVLRRHGFSTAKFREMPVGVPPQLLRPGVAVRYPADRHDEVSVSIVSAPRPQGDTEDQCISCGASLDSATAACNPFGCGTLSAMALHLRAAGFAVRVEMNHDRLVVFEMADDQVSAWLDNVERESERIAEQCHGQEMDEAYQ